MRSTTLSQEQAGEGPAAGVRRRQGHSFGGRRWFIFLTLAPAGIVLFMLTIYPFIMNIWYSLHSYNLTRPGVQPFVGLKNYVDLLTDTEFLAAVQRTFYYVVPAVGLELILGLLIAILLSQNLHGESLFRSLLVIPLAATPVAVGLIWRLMYNPTGGLANHLLQAVGLPPAQWTSSARWVIPSLVLVDIWQWTPFVILILLAGLLALPEEPFEAARIDGASALQTFWYLTVPMLAPMIYVAALFRFIDCLKAFDIIWVMTGGGPGHSSTTLNIHAYRTGFEFLHMGTAATMAILMLVLAIGVSTALVRRSNL
jgi:multiple sugar transport system permease protein